MKRPSGSFVPVNAPIVIELSPQKQRRRHEKAISPSRLETTGDYGGFGGRGHPLHAVLGGVIIAAIVNGMALLGLPAAIQLMATALVLLASITVDVAVRRRGQTAR